MVAKNAFQIKVLYIEELNLKNDFQCISLGFTVK